MHGNVIEQYHAILRAARSENALQHGSYDGAVERVVEKDDEVSVNKTKAACVTAAQTHVAAANREAARVGQI